MLFRSLFPNPNCSFFIMGSGNSTPVQSNDTTLVKQNHYNSLLTNSFNFIIELGSLVVGILLTVLLIYLLIRCFCPHWTANFKCCKQTSPPPATSSRRKRQSSENDYESIERPSRNVRFSSARFSSVADTLSRYFTLRRQRPAYDLPYTTPIFNPPANPPTMQTFYPPPAAEIGRAHV